MNFLLDENFPKAAASVLREDGHCVFDVRGTAEEGMDDPGLFAKAQHLKAVLLTTDRDFFHTIPHLFDSHAGVVLIALRQPNRTAILSRLGWLLSHIHSRDFASRVFQLRDKSFIAYPSLG